MKGGGRGEGGEARWCCSAAVCEILLFGGMTEWRNVLPGRGSEQSRRALPISAVAQKATPVSAG